MHHLGLGISYPRILEITKSLSDDLTNQWKQGGVFCPSKLRKFIFTVMAKDNCDLNATSSTATQHYHGTSISVMQFPSDKNNGEEIPKPKVTEKRTTSKKVQCLPSSYVETKAVYFPKDPLYAPKCENVSDKYEISELYSQEYSNEIDWLEEVINALPKNINVNSCSEHHAKYKKGGTIISWNKCNLTSNTQNCSHFGNPISLHEHHKEHNSLFKSTSDTH